MPRNGSGQYNLPYDWNDDKANGIKVLASRMQTQDQDIANALTDSLSSDGQTPLTGNLDFNGNKCVDLVDGTDAGDSVNVSQVQTGELQFFGVSTTTPAGTNGLNYDLGPTPSILVYPDYVRFSFVCHFTCIDNPNVRFGTLSTKTLKKSNGSGGYTALEAGDMVANKEYIGVLNADINAADIIIENVENNNTSSSVQSGDSQARTIAAGAITIKNNLSSYTVDTESSAATDDLDTITGGRDGQIICLRTANASRNVVLRHNVGNIFNPNGFNITLDLTTDLVLLRYDSNLVRWVVAAMSTFGSTVKYLIETKNASSSSSISFTGLSSVFSSYEIEFENVIPSVDGAGLIMQFSTDNGLTYINSNYASACLYSETFGTTLSYFQNNSTRFTLVGFDSGAGRGMENTSSEGGLSGTTKIFNPSSTTKHKIFSDVVYPISGATYLSRTEVHGWYTASTSPVNAIRFKMSTANADTDNGNISTGKFKLYGII